MSAVSLTDAAATEEFGCLLGKNLRPGDTILLNGEIGAGKTTMTRGILRGLGLAGDVASPTFPIVIAYDPPHTLFPVWHVDLYRIEGAAELEELALEEALIDGALIIEWPEQVGPALQARGLKLFLERDGAFARRLTAHMPAAWEKRWPPR